MISAWWLFLIIPVTFCAGMVFAGLLSANKQFDEFDEYMLNQYFQNEKEKSE